MTAESGHALIRAVPNSRRKTRPTSTESSLTQFTLPVA